MKKSLFLLIFSLILIGCEKKVHLHNIQEMNGILYKVDRDTSYSGTLIYYYKNGKIKKKTKIYKMEYPMGKTLYSIRMERLNLWKTT